MKQPTKSPDQSEQLEQSAQEMRSFVKDAQRKLLEFEVMMSTAEIKQGKTSSYKNVDELLQDVS